jgi:hypothetical protein
MALEGVMPPYNASDPMARFLNSSCLDFLLIELVPMAYRVTNELEAARASASQNGTRPAAASASASASASVSTIAGGPGRAVAGSAKMDEDEERDAVLNRLETLGYRVGQGLAER